MLCKVLNKENQRDASLEISVHIKHEPTEKTVLPFIEAKLRKLPLHANRRLK